MGLEWEKLYELGTDAAGFLFYHPARLAHRKNSPIGWWMDDAAEEFRAGRLVAFGTGSDGIFTLRFIRRPLTPAEEKVLVVRESFRYDGRDGRLYWDNGTCLPCEDQLEDAEDDREGWLGLPAGAYRVTVHALDWFSVPEAERLADPDIAHYMVRFEPVASLEDVPAPGELPWLLPSKPGHQRRAAEHSESPEAEPGAAAAGGG